MKVQPTKTSTWELELNATELLGHFVNTEGKSALGNGLQVLRKKSGVKATDTVSAVDKLDTFPSTFVLHDICSHSGDLEISLN